MKNVQVSLTIQNPALTVAWLPLANKKLKTGKILQWSLAGIGIVFMCL